MEMFDVIQKEPPVKFSTIAKKVFKTSKGVACGSSPLKLAAVKNKCVVLASMLIDVRMPGDGSSQISFEVFKKCVCGLANH